MTSTRSTASTRTTDLMEWGPAHLRDDADLSAFDASDRPDDN